jgi:hypothetical protein
MKWWIWALLAAWVVALVGLGCSPTADPGGGGQSQISRDTPDHLLNFLAAAYQEKNGDDYEVALHDAFYFVFTPEVADSLGLNPEEPWWGKTKDVASTKKMFGATEVTDVSMHYESIADWDPIDEERPDTTYSGVWSRVYPEIKVTISHPGEEPMVYWVDRSYLDITVVKDPTRPDQNLWVILRIEEHTIND